MTAGLNVLFGPKNLKIKQEDRNDSHIVHVHFESNPVPSAENVTFVIERGTDCGEQEDLTETCQPISVMAGSAQNNFEASPLENKVSIMTRLTVYLKATPKEELSPQKCPFSLSVEFIPMAGH